MRKRLLMTSLLACAAASMLTAQEASLTPPESMVADGIPKIPASLAETAGRYGAYRSASLADWSPVKREMLIATRFGDTPRQSDGEPKPRDSSCERSCAHVDRF